MLPASQQRPSIKLCPSDSGKTMKELLIRSILCSAQYPKHTFPETNTQTFIWWEYTYSENHNLEQHHYYVFTSQNVTDEEPRNTINWSLNGPFCSNLCSENFSIISFKWKFIYTSVITTFTMSFCLFHFFCWRSIIAIFSQTRFENAREREWAE